MLPDILDLGEVVKFLICDFEDAGIIRLNIRRNDRDRPVWIKIVGFVGNGWNFAKIVTTGIGVGFVGIKRCEFERT